MTLQEQMAEDLKTAMRQGDELRRSVLRMARSAVHYEEIAQQKALDDAGVSQVIARMVRQHYESIEAFAKGKRPDLVQREEQELAILQEYLPRQLSDAELAELARKVAGEVGARGPSDKGRVMGRLMPQVKGRADGARVNAVVTRLLEERATE